jgi:hypothetical protein
MTMARSAAIQTGLPTANCPPVDEKMLPNGFYPLNRKLELCSVGTVEIDMAGGDCRCD